MIGKIKNYIIIFLQSVAEARELKARSYLKSFNYYE